jgi:hypothetical protein
MTIKKAMPRSIVLLLLMLALLPLLALGSRQRGVRRRSRSLQQQQQSPRPSNLGVANGIMHKIRVGIHDDSEEKLASSISNKSTMGAAVAHPKLDHTISAARRPNRKVAIETHRRLEGFDSRQGSYADMDSFVPDLRRGNGKNGKGETGDELEDPVAALEQEEDVVEKDGEEGDKEEDEDEVDIEEDIEEEAVVAVDEENEGKDEKEDKDEDIDILGSLSNVTNANNVTNATVFEMVMPTEVEDGMEEGEIDVDMDTEAPDEAPIAALEQEEEKEEDTAAQGEEEVVEKDDKDEEDEGEAEAEEDKADKQEKEEDIDEEVDDIGEEVNEGKDEKEDKDEVIDILGILSNVTNVTNATLLETAMLTEAEDMDEGDIDVDMDTEVPSDNILSAQEVSARDEDDFFVKPETIPGLVLIEPEPCIPLKAAYWYMSNYEMNEAKCMEDPNSCSGGCCRLDDHVRCDETNSEPNLKCICNHNTAANNLNTNINKLLRK